MVKRRIIFCSESLRVPTGPTKPDQQYSIDAQAIIELLKNNFPVLREDLVETEPRGFKGKDDFMKKVPTLVKNTFETFRHRLHELEIFIIALRDTDTKDGKKISAIRRKLADKIKKLISEQEFQRVHIMFAVQAIEAWVLADVQKLNEYLGVTNKAKHENEPEKIEKPKQKVQNLFMECGKQYTPQALLDLLPHLRVLELLRCKHFKELYDCVQKIVETAV
jgi:hypothetical protein